MTGRTESEFLELVEQTMRRIEEALDATGLDLDYGRDGKVITIEVDDRSQIIINAQAAVQELWLASRCGAYHFRWVEGQWRDTRTAETFSSILSRDFSTLVGSAYQLAC
jgi:CyaY protein